MHLGRCTRGESEVKTSCGDEVCVEDEKQVHLDAAESTQRRRVRADHHAEGRPAARRAGVCCTHREGPHPVRRSCTSEGKPGPAGTR